MQLEDQDIAWAKSAIQKTEFFALCTEDEMELLINGMGKESYRPGSPVLFQGEISSKLLLVQSGSVFVPFHFAETAANVLTNPALDPVVKIPEFKICAVKLEKVA